MTIFLAIILVILIGLSVYVGGRTRNKSGRTHRNYEYSRRDSVMTAAEAEFFRRLEEIVSDRYYVFPQQHLSSLLNHQIKNGQSWKGALSAIQRKSVDYVLADKTSLQTIYAIELDDYTHDAEDRMKRDTQVETLFKSVGIPLVRLHDVQSLKDSDITNALAEAKRQKYSQQQ